MNVLIPDTNFISILPVTVSVIPEKSSPHIYSTIYNNIITKYQGSNPTISQNLRPLKKATITGQHSAPDNVFIPQ